MGKRQTGFGAVYRRRDGRWEGQIRIPGGRRRSFYAHSRRDLIDQLAEARWPLGEGLPSQCRNVVVARLPRIPAAGVPEPAAAHHRPCYGYGRLHT